MTVAHTPARYAREADRLPDGETSIVLDPRDITPILGSWWNSNRSSWGISRLEVTERDGQIWIHLWGNDPESGQPCDWGEAALEHLYTDGPRSNRVCSYTATFDLGHARTQIQTNMNHGLTIVAAFTTFTDGSGRANYLSREFYHKR